MRASSSPKVLAATALPARSSYSTGLRWPELIAEDWPVRPAARLFYGQEKAELEHLLEAEAASSGGLDLYLLRPPIVLGPNAVGAKDVLPGVLAPLGRRLFSRPRRLPIPVPVPLFSFSGSRASKLGDLGPYGKQVILFYTQTKTITERWFDPRSGLYCPARWRMRMESEAATVELDLRAHGRCWFNWVLKTGIRMNAFFLCTANGEVRLADGTVIPFDDVLVANNWLRTYSTTQETL